MTTFVPAMRVLRAPQAPTIASTAERLMPFAVVALVFAVCMLFPDLAFAQDAKAKVSQAGKDAFDLVFAIVYWVCGIAVMVAGLGATFGRMEWGRFGQIVAGIVVVFSAAMIVDYFK